MENQNHKIYNLYTPLRNKIRKYNLVDSIYLVWAYSQNLTFNTPMPSDVELPGNYSPLANVNDRRYRGMQEFELEFLIREFILHCHQNPTQNTLRQRSELRKVVNYLRFDFDNGIYGVHRNQQTNNILIEFNRIVHRQFKWQLGYEREAILRNYKIYTHPVIEGLLSKKFGMTAREIYIIGFYLFHLTGKHFRIQLPFSSETEVVTKEMIDTFFLHFAMTIEEAKKSMTETQRIDDTIYYSFNPLSAKPILLIGDSFSCPLHLLLFLQVTSGIYYSLVKEKGFDGAFGTSFENYVGEVLGYFCDKKKFQIISEQKYGNQEKKSTDWILADKDTLLFIECKTKRMTLASKSEIDQDKGLNDDLRKMAEFITQIYKTYLDYSNNKYPNLKYDPQKKFIPLVLTLEPWYVNANPFIMSLINEAVINEFKVAGLDLSLLESSPYQIRSCQEFESDIQMINSLGIEPLFRMAQSNELIEYREKFKFKELFKGEFQKIFIDPFLPRKNWFGLRRKS